MLLFHQVAALFSAAAARLFSRLVLLYASFFAFPWSLFLFAALYAALIAFTLSLFSYAALNT